MENLNPTHAMNTRLIRRFLMLGCLLAALFITLPLGAVQADRGAEPMQARVQDALNLQAGMTDPLLEWDGVLGTAVGLDDQGIPALVVYLDRDSPMLNEMVQAFPSHIRGISMMLHVTDRFRAMASTTVSHKAQQTPPIQLGTSGGWRNDLANGYCCGGTLGSLIQVNGVQYILSNYHVFESDIVPGGNGVVATTGSYVIQPGLIDVGCNANNAQNVATLVQLSALPNNNVDCSVAQVVPGMVRTDGAILEIGTLSAQTVAATLNKAVKKSGRTTGLTRSSINGLNATIKVTYENECAGGTAFTRTFTGQIVIANKGSKFLNSGDSGSLLVEDIATKPRAVGLLYAGSTTSAIANPINEVLTFVGGKLGGPATMVGN